jgi:hypothetical protein
VERNLGRFVIRWRVIVTAKVGYVGTALRAAISVAVASTSNTLLHPFHAARVILGLEHEKSVFQKIEEEEARIASHAHPSQANT